MFLFVKLACVRGVRLCCSMRVLVLLLLCSKLRVCVVALETEIVCFVFVSVYALVALFFVFVAWLVCVYVVDVCVVFVRLYVFVALIPCFCVPVLCCVVCSLLV